MIVRKLLSQLLPVMLALAAPAADWPQWRGPNFNGATDETNLPSSWTKETAVWSTDMPGPSAATPAILGDLVFVSTTDMSDKTLHALCLDRKSGKVLWNRQVGEGSIQKDDRSNYASPSPVAEAGRVFFFYGNGTLVAFDHAGKELWKRDIVKEYGDFAFNWTFSSSPTLYGGKLYLQVLQRNVPVRGHGRSDGPNESFLLALDPATGKELWRQLRPTDAIAESFEAYSTPIPFEHAGRKEILIVGADHVTGHDPESGKELWRTASLNLRRAGNWRQVASIVTGEGIVLACQPQRNPVSAIQAGGSGVLPDSAIVWNSGQRREVSSDVPTPLFYQGDFFVLSDGQKSLTRVEPATGNVKWTVKLPGQRDYQASPTGADGKLYFMNFGGDLVVVDAANGAVLSTMAMGEPNDDLTRSSIPAVNGQLFIRTNHKLFCVGKK